MDIESRQKERASNYNGGGWQTIARVTYSRTVDEDSAPSTAAAAAAVV